MVRRTLRRSDYEKSPCEAWNAFVDLTFGEPPEVLTDIQRQPGFALHYDSEVQNGGHLQYFENLAVSHVHIIHRVDDTLRSLAAIGANCQRGVLSRAAKRWNERVRRRLLSVEQYVENAMKGEFRDLDEEYYECRPEVTQLLKAYLDLHFDEFIELT